MLIIILRSKLANSWWGQLLKQFLMWRFLKIIYWSSWKFELLKKLATNDGKIIHIFKFRFSINPVFVFFWLLDDEKLLELTFFFWLKDLKLNCILGWIKMGTSEETFLGIENYIVYRKELVHSKIKYFFLNLLKPWQKLKPIFKIGFKLVMFEKKSREKFQASLLPKKFS